MSLEVKKSIKKYIPKIILGIIAVVLVACVIRLYTWESHYYAEKEGSERAVTVNGDLDTEEVSDEVVTEEQRNEYTVADDQPRYLYIEKLGIDKARIFPVSTNAKGQMQTPKTTYDAAWYTGSNLPGTGGTAVLNGHSGVSSSHGIFKDLNKLEAGDIIKIEMGNGTTYSYRVYDNFEVKLSEANDKMPMLMISPVQGEESISIISCTGEYSLQQKTYLSRQFLRATRV